VFQRGPGWEVAYRQTRDSCWNNELEWRNACLPVRLAVIGHGQYGEYFIPTARVVCDVMSELCSHGSIVPLDLTIGLWVVCRVEVVMFSCPGQSHRSCGVVGF